MQWRWCCFPTVENLCTRYNTSESDPSNEEHKEPTRTKVFITVNIRSLLAADIELNIALSL